jgi:hypothetical protein
MTNPKYPHGKLNDNDEGELGMAISHENGNVVLNFNKPVAWIGMPPEQAMGLAQLLIDHARMLNPGVPLTVTLGTREPATKGKH